MKSDDFLNFDGFTLGPCKCGPLLQEILATPLSEDNCYVVPETNRDNQCAGTINLHSAEISARLRCCPYCRGDPRDMTSQCAWEIG